MDRFERLNKANPEYLGRIIIAMDKLPIDGLFSIENNVKTENRELFIDCIKALIDNQYGAMRGIELEFSHDYKFVKKKRTLKSYDNDWYKGRARVKAGR